MSINKKYDLEKFIYDESERDYYLKKMGKYAKELTVLASQLKTSDEFEIVSEKISETITMLHGWEQCFNKINSRCNHDIVLHLGKVDLENPDKGYAVCIMCKKEFSVLGLEHESINFPENVINVDGILSPVYTSAFDGKENVLALRAREKLLQIASSKEADRSFELIRQDILEDLVYYTDELEYRKVIPRKRSRMLSNK